jgi:preprotein translocase subunit SecA
VRDLPDEGNALRIGGLCSSQRTSLDTKEQEALHAQAMVEELRSVLKEVTESNVAAYTEIDRLEEEVKAAQVTAASLKEANAALNKTLNDRNQLMNVCSRTPPCLLSFLCRFSGAKPFVAACAAILGLTRC